jgi:hypothetical protein
MSKGIFSFSLVNAYKIFTKHDKPFNESNESGHKLGGNFKQSNISQKGLILLKNPRMIVLKLNFI